jgi:hypothetical protein
MLQHVSIEIPPDEVDRSVEFWGLLGFDEVESPEPLGDAVRWLERDGTRDAGFQVEDTRQLWGADRAFVIAPGGHRVELMAEPPPRSN